MEWIPVGLLGGNLGKCRVKRENVASFRFVHFKFRLRASEKAPRKESCAAMEDNVNFVRNLRATRDGGRAKVRIAQCDIQTNYCGPQGEKSVDTLLFHPLYFRPFSRYPLGRKSSHSIFFYCVPFTFPCFSSLLLARDWRCNKS